MQTSTSSLSRSIVLGSKLSSALAKHLERVVLKARRAIRAVGKIVVLHLDRGTAIVEKYDALHALLGTFDLIDVALRRAKACSGADAGIVELCSQPSKSPRDRL